MSAPAHLRPAVFSIAPEIPRRSDEIQFLHKRSLVLLQQERHFLRRRHNFWRPSRSRQPHLRRFIASANHGRIDVTELVNLCCAQKSHVPAPALQPVAKKFRHGHHRIRRFRQLAVTNRKRQYLRLRSNRPRFVNQHDVRCMSEPRQVCRRGRQTDPDKTHAAIPQPARGGDGHDFARRIFQFSDGCSPSLPPRCCGDIRQNPLCPTHAVPSTREKFHAPAKFHPTRCKTRCRVCNIHARKKDARRPAPRTRQRPPTTAARKRSAALPVRPQFLPPSRSPFSPPAPLLSEFQ